MKQKEKFQQLHQKHRHLGLTAKFILIVIITVLCSIVLSYFSCSLLKLIIPFLNKVPFVIQLLIFSLAIAFLASIFITRFFIAPIQNLRQGMQQVAEGNFDIQLESKNSSSELQEVIVGFNMMVNELKSTEILQSDFVSNVSHEFKTPINAIEGYATLLQSCDHTDAYESEYIEKILFNTKRLSTLVSNVLLMSKIDNQSLQHQKKMFDISEQIREELLVLEPAWTEKDIEFEVDLDDVQYEGYENLMRHVWSNLIGNAVKFSPQGGEIRISLHKSGEALVFTVEDQGIGITEETQKHIFDKFYQGDTSHKNEGNGLGLALVKRIVALSDGEIRAESRNEGGCRFVLTLKQMNI